MYSSELKCIRTTWDRICQRKEKTSAGCSLLSMAPGLFPEYLAATNGLN